VNRKVIAAVIAAAAVSLSAWSLAADRDKPAAQGMTSGCPMMGGGMGSHMQGGGMMPQLPPGNEKLQLQMWGEMMQKMGEIASKYAAQVK
jgi:Spy/CpxP family protein refolding chaperone